jgi:hypothetical protein
MHPLLDRDNSMLWYGMVWYGTVRYGGRDLGRTKSKIVVKIVDVDVGRCEEEEERKLFKESQR